MIKYTIPILVFSIILISGCVNQVPAEYASHPCVDFCYIPIDEDTQIDKTFVFLSEKYSDLLDDVEKPVCRDYPEEEKQKIKDYFDSGGSPDSISPPSPCEGGYYAFCDCQLKDGRFVTDVIKEDYEKYK